jgi:hypothetical protein
MSEVRDDTAGQLDPTQATELSLLIDLEARWENLRRSPGGGPGAGGDARGLQARQRAYEAFRARLAAYNGRYAPAHRPELLLNTPSRLGVWCRRMRDLYLQIERDPRAHSPAHLLEKAYRWADRVGVRLNREPVNRVPPPAGIRAAIEGLEEVARWCDGAGAAASPGGTSPTD